MGDGRRDVELGLPQLYCGTFTDNELAGRYAGAAYNVADAVPQKVTVMSADPPRSSIRRSSSRGVMRREHETRLAAVGAAVVSVVLLVRAFGFFLQVVLLHRRFCLGLFLLAAVVAGVQTPGHFVLPWIDVVVLAHGHRSLQVPSQSQWAESIGHRPSAAAVYLRGPSNGFSRQAQSRTARSGTAHGRAAADPGRCWIR